MNVFSLQNRLTEDYSAYIRSFISIRDARIGEYVELELKAGLLWPEPMIQLNPSFEPGCTIDELVSERVLHPECAKIFRVGKDRDAVGKPLRLHRHQEEAIRAAVKRENYVLTTGTGSGKSLAYLVPIVDHVLRKGSEKGVRAIIVYPMNALANSQMGELEKFINAGYPDQRGPIRFARYTGQEKDEQKEAVLADPPDIILTNYVMLELILTRPRDRKLVEYAKDLQFLVLDELHTYRGRQGADVSLLVRRVREDTSGDRLQCVGTSATVAGTGTIQEQQEQVAAVSSTIFGAPVKPENVIGETLKRVTPEQDASDPRFWEKLTESVSDRNRPFPKDFRSLAADPFFSWIESTFGVTKEDESERLIRSKPRTILGEDGAAKELSKLTGVSEEHAADLIQKVLLASYDIEPDPQTDFQPFAFKLHQFISRGDTVYATLETEDQRYITVRNQQYKPGDRSKVLLPLTFCRVCGQEYYCVRLVRTETGTYFYEQRELSDYEKDDGRQPGFLYFSTATPWPEGEEELLSRLPDDWLEEHDGKFIVSANRRDYLPKLRYLKPDATPAEKEEGALRCHYFQAPFRFCLNCGVSYDFRQRSDFGKLSALGSEGRSTATTILSLSAARALRSQEMDLPEKARKLLSFTDNRQDASLQAGHFNDFVEIGILRAAVYKAVEHVGSKGIAHDELTEKVFSALNLPIDHYASDPDVRFAARADTERAFKNVLGYRLYRDLRRGWRVTSPNLEQCGLLEIHYESLEELSKAEDIWEKTHPSLKGASPETRIKVAKVLLDFMRRELAIHVDYLNDDFQYRLRQQSSQRLKPPWALDEDEKLEHAEIALPRPRRPGDYGGFLYLSPRGGFGNFLRRQTTFPESSGKLDLEETGQVIQELLEALKLAGLVKQVREAGSEGEVPGHQIPASAMRWVAGDGSRPFHDVIRMPSLPEDAGTTNAFFVDFYKNVAARMLGVEAREHTAQVPYQVREEREERFREGRLPILYCSPTMELGVDIAQLNVVNLRNVPPTPANYAQRSGRAGRSGQPALVFTYCASGSPHDQYFFKQPEQMVMGSVTPPRLDLANEDLVAAHVRAIWLAETGASLGKSLADVLDLSTKDLEILASLKDAINAQAPRDRALPGSRRVLESMKPDLEEADWFTDEWLKETLSHVGRDFDRACERWRNLYVSARTQRDTQHAVVSDPSRSPQDREKARSLRAEAENQLEILTQGENIIQSDFYSYRYFASEGFLPGYNFPRLPLSAYIPARRQAKGENEFLSRPRFLAISEFGPRAFIYHEGSRYIINKVILPIDEEERDLATRRAKQCHLCGYLHPITKNDGPDLCESCGTALRVPFTNLFRLRNVSTKRRDRINCDEEERLRLGYEIQAGYRFAEPHGRPSFRKGELKSGESLLASLRYGHAANIWRINLGWRRRRSRQDYGFYLDTIYGYWKRNPDAIEDDLDDPYSERLRKVIPYVEDRKNCLVLEWSEKLSETQIASLQAALKNAVQLEYQLEDNELAVEPLPDRDHRHQLLFYESAEGGAGVLRHLVGDPAAFGRVARRGLSLCHFDPDSGEDRGRARRAKEDCEAACYDCLMSYTNQMDHKLLDRKTIRDFLLQARDAHVETSPVEISRSQHLERLLRRVDSDLERKWLKFIDENDLKLPTDGQKLIETAGTRADFVYSDCSTLIYVDGPHHEYPERQKGDREQQSMLEDQGYTVIRFGHEDEWEQIVNRFPHVFGKT